MTNVPPVRAVLWDADGVLQHTPPDAWDPAREVIGAFPGALTGTPVDETRIREVVARRGLAGREEEILAVWSTFALLEASLEVVAAVRATGTPCYLATNQDSYRAACMQEHLPYAALLDGAYYSCAVGAAKPSPEYFGHVADDLGLRPADLLFLDDQPENVEGARAVGLAAEQWVHTDGIPRLHALLGRHGIRL